MGSSAFLTGLGLITGNSNLILKGTELAQAGKNRTEAEQAWGTALPALFGGQQNGQMSPLLAPPGQAAPVSGGMGRPPAATFTGPAPASPAGVKAAAAGRVPDDAARNTYALAIQAGMPPMQAAVWTGNVQQESSFNPANLNEKEGAYGLIQWRESRRRQLEEFARKRGTRPDDPETQARFSLWEMTEGPPEQRGPGQAFLAAKTPEEANQALKRYIRYGDDSYGTRLENSRKFLGLPAGGAQASPQAGGSGASALALSPQQVQTWAKMLSNPATSAIAQKLLADRAGKTEEDYTLSPGDVRFRGGRPIAQVPQNATTQNLSQDYRDWQALQSQGQFQGPFMDYLRAKSEASRAPEKPPETWIPLTTPQERTAFGIPADSKQAWQYNPVTKKLQAEGSGGGTNVNVTNKQDSEYSKVRGKSYAEEADRLIKAGTDADTKIAQYQRLDALLSDPNVYTGTGAETVQSLKKLGSTLLGRDFKGVGSAEAAQTIVSELALQMGQLMKPMSDSDRRFLESLPPNLGNSAAGRKAIVAMTIDAERRKQQIAELARAYERMNGQLDSGWDETLAGWLKENPLFTPERQKAIMGSAEATPQPPPDAGVLPRVVTDEDYEKLPRGTLYFDPQNNRRKKP